jgi:hypothetical protein
MWPFPVDTVTWLLSTIVALTALRAVPAVRTERALDRPARTARPTRPLLVDLLLGGTGVLVLAAFAGIARVRLATGRPARLAGADAVRFARWALPLPAVVAYDIVQGGFGQSVPVGLAPRRGRGLLGGGVSAASCPGAGLSHGSSGPAAR